MRMLAFELSTGSGSLALLRDGAVEHSWQWTEQRRQSRLLFDHLAEVDDLAGIDVFAVGIGPGNYTGLRTSITAAQALALPGDDPVYCVSSGDAMVATEAANGPAVVIGDARRGQLWSGWFTDGTRSDDWALGTWDEIAKRLTPETRIFSPDALRIAEHYPVADLPLDWPTENAAPRAVAVGNLASQRIAAGIPSELATPLYLQPPV